MEVVGKSYVPCSKIFKRSNTSKQEILIPTKFYLPLKSREGGVVKASSQHTPNASLTSLPAAPCHQVGKVRLPHHLHPLLRYCATPNKREWLLDLTNKISRFIFCFSFSFYPFCIFVCLSYAICVKTDNLCFPSFFHPFLIFIFSIYTRVFVQKCITHFCPSFFIMSFPSRLSILLFQ